MVLASLSGHSRSSLKKFYSIIPLYGMTGLACAFAVFTGVRTLFKNPDVMLDHEHDRTEKYRGKSSKLFGHDKEHTDCPAPKY